MKLTVQYTFNRYVHTDFQFLTHILPSSSRSTTALTCNITVHMTHSILTIWKNDTCDHHKVRTEPWRLSTLMFPQTLTIIDVCFLAQQPSVQSWAGACFVWAHRIDPTNKCVIAHRTAHHGSGARVLSGSLAGVLRIWCENHVVSSCDVEVKNSGMATFEGDIVSSFRISPQVMATRTAGGSDESDRVSRKRWSTSWANDWSCSIAVRQASTVVMSNDFIDVSTSWNVLDI